VDSKLRDDVGRLSEDHDVRRDRALVGLREVLETNAATREAALQQQFASVSREHGKLLEDTAAQHAKMLATVDKKLGDSVALLDREQVQKQEDMRASLEQGLEELRAEITGTIAEQELVNTSLYGACQNEVARVGADLAEVTASLEQRLEQVGNEVSEANSNLAAIETKLEADAIRDAEQRSQEMEGEREARGLQVADICAAVKSMETWLTDVDTSVARRNDACRNEIEYLNERVTELKEMFHDSVAKLHADQKESWQGAQIDKLIDRMTCELRKVVQDLAHTSLMQGDKIKELEEHFEAAREAKHEVVRLGSELRAEVAMRIRKQSDLESRMERDMGHFAQRVEHLATSTTNLNDDLRASRSTSQGKMSIGQSSSAHDQDRSAVVPDATNDDLEALGLQTTNVLSLDP